MKLLIMFNILCVPDCQTEALTKLSVIRPIRVESMLNYDHTVRRFDIQGILREVIRANFLIKNLCSRCMCSFQRHLNRKHACNLCHWLSKYLYPISNSGYK